MSSLVKALNSLPRAEKASSERVANRWYFDVRFVPLNPPSHLLTIIQINSGFIHTKELSVEGNDLAYFPESSQDAAPEIAKALIRSFAEDFAPNTEAGNPSALVTWAVVTGHTQLANAVSSEFEYCGVTVPELLKIGTATSSTSRLRTMRSAPTSRS